MKNPEDRIPLHSVEAEMSFLGSLLYMTTNLARVAIAEAQIEWFCRPAHRLIFRLSHKINCRGAQIDLVTLKRELVTTGSLEEIGGEEYLIRLAEFVPSPTNWKQYIDIIRQNWQLRSLNTLGEDVTKLVFDEEKDTEEKLAEARKLLRSPFFATGAPLIDVASITLSEDDESGVPTGIKGLDALTGYGAPRGQMSAACAYHKGGKTTFLIQTALDAMQSGLRVCYATMADLDPKQLKRRMLRQLCGWSKMPFELASNPTFDQAATREEFQKALDWLNDVFKDGGCEIFYGKVHGRYIEDVIAKVSSRHLEQPYDVMMLDYIQKTRSRERGAKDSKTHELEYVSDSVKTLAEDLDIPVWVGAQITRGDGKEEATTKYARAVEEDAGFVVHIDLNLDDNTGVLRVPYNRFGPPGSVKVGWDLDRVRFTEAG